MPRAGALIPLLVPWLAFLILAQTTAKGLRNGREQLEHTGETSPPALAKRVGVARKLLQSPEGGEQRTCGVLLGFGCLMHTLPGRLACPWERARCRGMHHLLLPIPRLLNPYLQSPASLGVSWTSGSGAARSSWPSVGALLKGGSRMPWHLIRAAQNSY